MAYSAKKKEYDIRYAKEHKERIVIDVNKGKKAQYKQLAASRGKSLSGFLIDYLESELQKESETKTN